MRAETLMIPWRYHIEITVIDIKQVKILKFLNTYDILKIHFLKFCQHVIVIIRDYEYFIWNEQVDKIFSEIVGL